MRPDQRHSAIELEHRLTVVEITTEAHSHDILQLKSKTITPRDWGMIAAGILAIFGALAGKISVSDAVVLLHKP